MSNIFSYICGFKLIGEMQFGIILGVLSAFWDYLKAAFEVNPVITVIGVVGCLSLIVGGLCSLYLLAVGDLSGHPRKKWPLPQTILDERGLRGIKDIYFVINEGDGKGRKEVLDVE